MATTHPDDDRIAATGRALTIREAASAVGVNSRTIRRRLAAGAFPGAYKDTDPTQPGAVVWRIPVEELEAAGLVPGGLYSSAFDEMTAELIATSPPTVASIVATDRFARLRSDLAEAVASAELALLRAQADRWRAVAEERGHALERADLALQTLSSALESRPIALAAPAPPPAAAPVAPAPPVAPGPIPNPIAPVPQHLRSEAVLYAESFVNRRTQRRWWRRKR